MKPAEIVIAQKIPEIVALFYQMTDTAAVIPARIIAQNTQADKQNGLIAFVNSTVVI